MKYCVWVVAGMWGLSACASHQVSSRAVAKYLEKGYATPARTMTPGKVTRHGFWSIAVEEVKCSAPDGQGERWGEVHYRYRNEAPLARELQLGSYLVLAGGQRVYAEVARNARPGDPSGGRLWAPGIAEPGRWIATSEVFDLDAHSSTEAVWVFHLRDALPEELARSVASESIGVVSVRCAP